MLQGGIAYAQHYVLRWYLWRAGHLPWRYTEFLNYAVERILLRKVGGGYIFAHRLLLEYFASLDPQAANEQQEPICSPDSQEQNATPEWPQITHTPVASDPVTCSV